MSFISYRSFYLVLTINKNIFHNSAEILVGFISLNHLYILLVTFQNPNPTEVNIASTINEIINSLKAPRLKAVFPSQAVSKPNTLVRNFMIDKTIASDPLTIKAQAHIPVIGNINIHTQVAIKYHFAFSTTFSL
ncbi:hypothetical protein HMPREF0072_0987 [Anaerococcus lactolyticus ATCC 51172]|uniref:Uncharacterized protein n=1 Tax=Anaerococcus lactolyticus ATCC 51172 TaxID=525254 RepID=C2BF67_9FIRM|nr:hypothetical protein HMPREF0072_0987 [Anaerococcus lactolyticus ATCC 51172]